MSTDAPGETISTATASMARHFGAGPSPRGPKVIRSGKIGTERTSPPSSDELASITPMEGMPIQAMIDAPIAVTRAPVSTSPRTTKGSGMAEPAAAQDSASSAAIQIPTSMIGPSRPNDSSRRGIGSEHHVGDVDHRLLRRDLLHEERDGAETAVARAYSRSRRL